MQVQTYRSRRERLMEQLGDGLILVRGAAPDGESSNPNLRYLTGLDEPRAALLLAPQGVRVAFGRAHHGPDQMRGRMVQQALFLPSVDPLLARWGEGPKVTREAVTSMSVDVDWVDGAASLTTVLSQALLSAQRLHYVRSQHAGLAGDDDDDTQFIDQIRRRFVGLDVHDATADVHAMRRLKDTEEQSAIEKSVAVVHEAFRAVMPLIRPGVRENQIEAEIARVYRSHGGTHAFDPIVGSGKNSLVLHYTANAGTLQAGEVLLIDTGVQIDGYAADITRTFPVDGRFTDRQREIYDAVLDGQQAAIGDCKPGALLPDLHATAWQRIETAGLGDHYIHGIGHHMGLDVHDVGDVHQPLAAGAVVTIEPGAYVPDEAIGVRIEDDVLITADGHRVLSDAIPKAPEQLERLLAECA